AISARSALVGREYEERFCRPILVRGIAVELDLGHRRPGASYVAGRRVGEQVLTGCAQPRVARDRSRDREGAPGEPMDRSAADPVSVGHDDRDIVSSMHDDAVDQEPSRYGAPDTFPDNLEHGC